MELLNLLASFNKISLIAFLITFIFLIYEIHLFKKETIKKQKPIIPAFNDAQATPQYKASSPILSNNEKNIHKKNSNLPIILSIILLIIFGVISVIGIISSSSAYKTKASTFSSPVVNIVISKGIVIYDKDWKELSEQELNGLKNNDKIYIGLHNINNADIDQARIKVNKPEWSNDDITTQFDKDKNLYYKEYIVGSQEAELKIEAQLHSKTDSWLGD